MISPFSMFLLTLQAAGQTPVAISPEKPKTWSVEYPVMISPYVDEYRGCLYSGNRTIGDDVDFEIQHQSDIPRCSEVAERVLSEANAMLAKRGRGETTTPADVASVFDMIRLIHVERGRDLDEHIRVRLAANPIYRQVAPGNPEGQGNASVQ